MPSGTILYGEKGTKTGTRVRASRYGIRECTGVSLWDALMFGRLGTGCANVRAGARVLTVHTQAHRPLLARPDGRLRHVTQKTATFG